jgi:lipopolysaccharide export system permease protein
MFIFEMQFIWLYLDDMVGKGLDVWVFIKLFLFVSARLVNMALPLAILMSSIMTMGALAENNELTAIKGAGVPLWRILRPLVLFHIVLSIGAFAFANNIWPIANLKFRTLLYGVVQQRPALNLNPGVFYNGIEGISIRVMQKNPDTEEVRDILIYDHRDRAKGNRTVIRAEKGTMGQTPDKRFLLLTLNNGYSYDEPVEKSKKNPELAMIRSRFEQTVLRLDLSSFAFKADNEDIFKNSFEMMTIPQLSKTIDSLQVSLDSSFAKTASTDLAQFHLYEKQKNYGRPRMDTLSSRTSSRPKLNEATTGQHLVALTSAAEITRRTKDSAVARADEFKAREKFIVRHKIEYHRKFFLAVVCMVLFFIGAPLGSIIRKGGLGLPTIIALGLFIFYQLLTIAGERMAKAMIIEPWVGMWMSTAVLLPLSIWINYKASKEARLVEKDFYLRFWNRILRFLHLKKTALS